MTTIVSIAQGGTGANNASDALDKLGALSNSGGTIHGDVEVSGNVLPTSNVTYDLGSSTSRWKDLWLSGTTINLGGASIKTDNDSGAIALIPKPTVETPDPVAVVVSPTGGITTVETTGGVPSVSAITEAATANTATPVPIDIVTTAPANGQALIWNSVANTFVPGNVAASGGVSGGTGTGNPGAFKNSFVGDGSTDTFELSLTPTSESHIIVFVDGVLQTNVDYSLSSANVIFNSAPVSDANVEVITIGDSGPQGPQGPQGDASTVPGPQGPQGPVGATGTGPKVTKLIYPEDDTAANTAGGQIVYVTGSGFAANANVYINGNVAPSISFISASNLAITTPALSAATYPVYVINPEDGATAIHIPGLLVSGDPSWVTSEGSLSAAQDEASAWSYTVSATSDSAVTYALASGSSLPSGISLAANGLISGTLSSPPGIETTYNFTVEATDAENQNATRAFSVTVSSGEGVLFANNVLLIHADGTNNQNNHTFLDSSNNNFTVTRTGTPTQGSFSPFSQTGWSAYFDGDNDTLRMSGNVLSGAGNVTIECWVYPETTSVVGIFDGGPSQAGVIRNYPANSIEKQSNGTPATFSLTPNTWSHFATTFSGGVIKVYVNGVNTGNGTYTGDYTVGTNFDIGGINAGADGDFKGYISNFRVTKSIVYSGNFTPPTTPLSPIENTTLLTCQSNRFIDNSNNAYAITRNNDVSIQPWSPFAPTSAYSAADVGGSVYMDAGTNGLTLSSVSAIGTNDFTVEGWFWPLLAGAEFPGAWTFNVADFNGTTSMQGAVGTDKILFRYNGQGGFSITSGVNLKNQWNHIAWVRNGNVANVYLNGVSVGSGAFTNSISGGNAYISRPDNSNFRFNGWISGFRAVSGTAIYTGNFTPPTSAPTNVANTLALLNFTNAGIVDQTAKNIMQTVGDAKVSTTQYKYGTASMYFDGSGDGVKVISGGYPTLANFPKSGFVGTIEMWVYLNALTSPRSHLIGLWSNNEAGWTIDVNTSGDIFFANNGAGNTPSLSTKVTTGSWIHLAFVNTGSIINIYLNGVNVGTTTNYTPSTSTQPLYIGMRSDGTLPTNGYIDDVRITQGYARYTTTFTPPTAAFKDK